MLFSIEMTFIGSPVICIESLDIKGGQKSLKLFEHLILPLAENVSENSIRCMIYSVPLYNTSCDVFCTKSQV